jgi:hypothetical protein
MKPNWDALLKSETINVDGEIRRATAADKYRIFFAPPMREWPDGGRLIGELYSPEFVSCPELDALQKQLSQVPERRKGAIAGPLFPPALEKMCFSKSNDFDIGGLYEYWLKDIDSNRSYLPILSIANYPWQQGFYRHLRIAPLRIIEQAYKIPPRDIARFPDQIRLTTLVGTVFLKIENERLEKYKHRFPPMKNVARAAKQKWEPTFEFCMARHGPADERIIDFFSRPCLTLRED